MAELRLFTNLDFLFFWGDFGYHVVFSVLFGIRFGLPSSALGSFDGLPIYSENKYSFSRGFMSHQVVHGHILG